MLEQPADQLSFFGPADSVDAARAEGRMRVLVTVTAAPNPSVTYGETVCVAGLRLDPDHAGWVRLYPVNLRHLSAADRFRKYDVIDLQAFPQTKNDQRLESWGPRIDTVRHVAHLPPWRPRMQHLAPFVESDACAIRRAARVDPKAPSLALVRPRAVVGFDIEPHPGWSKDEQAKIDAYVSQLDLFGEDRSPLEAPRFRAWYRYRCSSDLCDGHRQGLIDWEFVAHQRHLQGRSDDDAVAALRQRWFTQMCARSKDVMFYLGNQAKRRHVFSVLGVVYPPR